MTLLAAAISVVCCAVYAYLELGFNTDRADLINPSAAFHQRWLRYTENFGDASDMVVVVQAKSPERIKRALDALGDRVAREPQLFTNVLYKVEPGRLREKGLYYLSPEQLQAGLERLEEYRPILDGNWDLVRMTSLIPRLRLQLAAASQSPADAAQADSLLAHSERLFGSMDRLLSDRNDFINPWPDLITLDPSLREQGNQTVYLINDSGTLGFLKVSPLLTERSFEGATAAIDRLRTLMQEVSRECTDVKLRLTGIPVLENDEMRRSRTDMGWASLISELGVAALILFGFRGVRHPFVCMVMLAVGTAWTFGFTTAVVGHLNILSVSFVTILIGLGCDFGIHFLARYLHLRHEGHEMRHALVETAEQVGPGIVTGAVTTSLAFFAAMFTDFLGVAELGLIAGGGILLCTVATFTVLPALVVVVDRRRETSQLPTPFRGDPLRFGLKHFPRTLLVAAVVVVGVIGSQIVDWNGGQPRWRVHYDHNLLNLQARGLESVDAQTAVFQGSKHSLLFAISLADSPEACRELKARFEALPTVHRVEELASRLPEHSSVQTKLYVQAFDALLARLPEKPEPPSPLTPQEVGLACEQMWKDLSKDQRPRAQALAVTLDHFLDNFEQLTMPQQMQFLGEFQYRLTYALLAQFQALAAAAHPEPVSLDDLPVELTSRFVSQKGKWLIQIFPKDQVWDMEPLSRFVNDVRGVDPEVTGTPLQNFEAALQIKQSYEIAALYALAVVCLVLLIDFLPRELWSRVFLPAIVLTGGLWGVLLAREVQVHPLMLVTCFNTCTFAAALWFDRQSVLCTITAMIPPVVSLLMTFGVMVWLQIPLNPANLIVLPLIVGLGVDSGVHLLHDYRAHRGRDYLISPSLVNAIVLTVTTTMVGFGAMMIAAHRGLQSLGAVVTIGVTSCLFMSMVPLPAALTIVSRWRRRTAEPTVLRALPGPAVGAGMPTAGPEPRLIVPATQSIPAHSLATPQLHDTPRPQHATVKEELASLEGQSFPVVAGQASRAH